MGRKRKGRALSGWVIVDKPVGPTSTAVVNKVRWAFQAQKAGHAGTLDPAASGLLAVALGEATKVIPYVTDALKAYRFTVRFGAATNTDDAEGEVIARFDLRPTDGAITEALTQFTGDILQVPPKYSAVKIDGERAYALARDGEDFEIEPRPLYVDELKLVARPDDDHAELEMVCGKGGYVRAIARDLGEALGCLGHVTALRRIWSGPFDVEEAVGFDAIEAAAQQPEIDQYLRPVSDGLIDLPQVTVGETGAVRLRNGNPGQVISAPADLEFGDTAWAAHKGEPLAIGIYRAGQIHPTRVLNLATPE